MELQDVKTAQDYQTYIEGLVNDFQGVEMPSDVTDKTIQMYKDIFDLITLAAEQAYDKGAEAAANQILGGL